MKRILLVVMSILFLGLTSCIFTSDEEGTVTIVNNSDKVVVSAILEDSEELDSTENLLSGNLEAGKSASCRAPVGDYLNFKVEYQSGTDFKFHTFSAADLGGTVIPVQVDQNVTLTINSLSD